MVTRTREFGGIQMPVLIGSIAAVVLGGVVLFMVSRPGAAKAQDTGVRPAPRADVEAPEAPPMIAPPRVAEDADKIMQGEMVKFRDENGEVRYRWREPVEGVSSFGIKTYWRLEARIHDAPVQKMKMNKETKAKFGRKNIKKGVASPPKLKKEGDNGPIVIVK